MRLAESGKMILGSWTKLMHTLWLVCALAGVLSLAGVCALASDTPDKSLPELVRSVVQQLSQRQITRIEIFYFDWGASVYGGMSKEDLLTQCQYKIVLADPLWNIDELQQALSDFRFHKVGSRALEYRIACVFYAGTKEVLRLFFANNAPVVSLGEELFQAEPALLNAVIAFLPHEAYERLHRSALAQWTYSYHP